MPTTRGQNGRNTERQPSAASSKKVVKKETKTRKASAKAEQAIAEVEEVQVQEAVEEEVKAAPRARGARATKTASKKSVAKAPVEEIEAAEEDSVVVEEPAKPSRQSRATRGTQASAAKATPPKVTAKARGQAAKSKAAVAEIEPALPASRATRRGKAAAPEPAPVVEEEPKPEPKRAGRKAAKVEEEPPKTVEAVEEPPKKSRATRAKKDEKPEVKAVEETKVQPKERARGRATSKATKVQDGKVEVIAEAAAEPEETMETEESVPAPKTRATRGTKNTASSAKEEPVKSSRATGKARATTSRAQTKTQAAPEEPAVAPKETGRKRKLREPTPSEEAVSTVELVVNAEQKDVEPETTTRAARGAKRRAVAKAEKPTEAIPSDATQETETEQPGDAHSAEQSEPIAMEAEARESTPEPTLLFADVDTPLIDRAAPISAVAEPETAQIENFEEPEPMDCEPESAPKESMQEPTPTKSTAAPVPVSLFGTPNFEHLATPAQRQGQLFSPSPKKDDIQMDAYDDVLEEGPAFSLSMISFPEMEEQEASAGAQESAVDSTAQPAQSLDFDGERMEIPTSEPFESSMIVEPADEASVYSTVAPDGGRTDEVRRLSAESDISKINRRRSEMLTVASNSDTKLSARRQTMFPKVAVTVSESTEVITQEVLEQQPEQDQREKSVEPAPVESTATSSTLQIMSPVKFAAIDEAQILAVASNQGQKQHTANTKLRRVSLHPNRKSSGTRSAPRRKSMFPSITGIMEAPVEEPVPDVSATPFKLPAVSPEPETASIQPRTSWTPINKPVSGLRRVSTSLASPEPIAKQQNFRRKSMYPTAATGKLVEKPDVQEESMVDAMEEEQIEGNLASTVLSFEEAETRERATQDLVEMESADIEMVVDGADETAAIKPLDGTTWYVSVYDKGECVNDLWIPGLEGLGAVVNQEWHDITEGLAVTHVLFNNGSQRTLQHAADTGAKCVKIGYVLDVESANLRLDEDDTKYKIDMMKHVAEVAPVANLESATEPTPMDTDLISSAPTLQATVPMTPKRSARNKENVPPIYLSPDKKTPRTRASPRITLGMQTCPPKQLMKPMLDPISKTPNGSAKKQNAKRRLSFDHSANTKRPQMSSPRRKAAQIPMILEEDAAVLF